MYDLADLLDRKKLTLLSNHICQLENGTIHNWTYVGLDPAQRNFVTGGVYRISGVSTQPGRDALHTCTWSLILKIVVPDLERGAPGHYNYWERELLAYDSAFLHRLLAGIAVPECLGIEERSEGTYWLWLADVQDDGRSWDQADYTWALERLGAWQAAYLLGEPLPEDSWINREWMRAWLDGCYRYRYRYQRDGTYQHTDEVAERIDGLRQLEAWVPQWLKALSKLPRTLSHQDYHAQNILSPAGEGQSDERSGLVLIDWQFLSISGVGEDLGRAFGLAISRGIIPPEDMDTWREMFMTAYMQGMRGAGWQGDERLVRFGFLAAFALRAIWEVPKLLQMLEQGTKRDLADVHLLQAVTRKQWEAAQEAEQLRMTLFGEGYPAGQAEQDEPERVQKTIDRNKVEYG